MTRIGNERTVLEAMVPRADARLIEVGCDAAAAVAAVSLCLHAAHA